MKAAGIAPRFAVVIASAAVLALFPAGADAKDYCVDTACGGISKTSFEDALAAADDDVDADRIILGAQRYTAPNGDGFKYVAASSQVEIVGQGIGRTVLTSPTFASNVLMLLGHAGSSVHDLTIQIPPGAQSGHQALVTDNTARRIEVVDDPATVNPTREGVVLGDGGTLEDSSVQLVGSQDTTAVDMYAGGATVRHSMLSARTGAVSRYGATIERSRVTAAEHGVKAYANATAIRHSLIRLTGTVGVGIRAETAFGMNTSVDADGVTIVGQGLPDLGGVTATTSPLKDQSVDLSVRNSIIRGVGTPLFAFAGGSGTAKIAASYSDYDPFDNPAIGNASIDEVNTSNVGDAGFVDPLGNYRLRPGSPLLDRGDPAASQGIDLDGNPLVADGNGDGVARRDLGAYETPSAGAPGSGPGGSGPAGGGSTSDLTAPVLARLRLAAGRVRVAQAGSLALPRARRLGLRFVASEPAKVRIVPRRVTGGRLAKAPGAIVRGVSAGKGSIALGKSLRRLHMLRVGQLRLIVTATDAAGNRSAKRVLKLRLRAAR